MSIIASNLNWIRVLHTHTHLLDAMKTFKVLFSIFLVFMGSQTLVPDSGSWYKTSYSDFKVKKTSTPSHVDSSQKTHVAWIMLNTAAAVTYRTGKGQNFHDFRALKEASRIQIVRKLFFITIIDTIKGFI